ncbi:MAG: hypothetical protein R3B82_08030 [Sandaracinaceae bacterium]
MTTDEISYRLGNDLDLDGVHDLYVASTLEPVARSRTASGCAP